MSDDSRELLLKFVGGQAEEHQVPAALLGQALLGLQRALYLVGMTETGTTVKARAKPGKDVRELFKLSCRPLKEGSLEALLQIGGSTGKLFDETFIEDGLNRFLQGLNSVEKNDAVGLTKAVPDRLTRESFLRALEGAVPDRQSEIQFALFYGARETSLPALSSVGLTQRIQSLREAAQSDKETQTIAGYLHEISFENNTIKLWYPPTKRQLTCSYQPEVEEMLLSHPRDLVRITGVVVVDERGHPERILDVHNIEELDLTPITVRRFSPAAEASMLNEPLEYPITHDDEYQVLQISDPDLDIILEASTRDELIEDLTVEFDVLWHNYALADDEDLTPSAVGIKRKLWEQVGLRRE